MYSYNDNMYFFFKMFSLCLNEVPNIKIFTIRDTVKYV